MFVREKTIRGYTYLYLVESVREGGRTKQRIVKNLGRKEQVLAAGDLDRLDTSVGRYAERAMVLAGIDNGHPDGMTWTLGHLLSLGGFVARGLQRPAAGACFCP